MNTLSACAPRVLRRQLGSAIGLVALMTFTMAVPAREQTRTPVQAPALPGAGAPISSGDRVYTADQSSNTVSVIDPATNRMLGTIVLGQPRVDGVLGPFDDDQVNVHGLGFSRDGRLLSVTAVTSNAAMVIDTASNKLVQTTYVRRAPHEGFISPDGKTLWVAERGVDTVAIIRLGVDDSDDKIRRIQTGRGPSKVVFSPDGRLAYVNHFSENVLVVIDVSSRHIVARIAVPARAGSSADEAISPDGEELWLGHPANGYVTVIDARRFLVKVSFETGPRTNHINFVTFGQAAYAYVTVGDLNLTKVYLRADRYNDAPRQTGQIAHTVVGDAGTNCQPHVNWPSPDNTRMYVALQKCDRVDVIDTASNAVIATIQVGQDPQALVYVAGATGSVNLGRQGLDKAVRNFKVEVRGAALGAAGQLQVRSVLGLDELDLAASGLTPNTVYTLYGKEASGGFSALMNVTSDAKGGVPEALAFVRFFDNWGAAVLAPPGSVATH
jgi:YVTN family beta-propeller protein